MKARPAAAATVPPVAAHAAVSTPDTVVARGPAAEPWGGPLAPVLDRLNWVAGRDVSRSDLAGRVVLVEFWAFDCINCRRTLPAMRALERRYRGTDVRVIGIHTPELARERDPRQVVLAVAREGIEYPVALDPEARVWAAFSNRYWPCLYVLDRNGGVRFRHIGELHEDSPGWDELARQIETLRAAK